MNTRIQFILVVVILAFMGCQDADMFTEQVRTFPEVDERLHSYFISFEEEAFARGYDVDLNEISISATIENIDEQGVAGQCQYHPSIINNHITIDEDFLFSNASDLIKEMIVFHELGHCFLQRGHREDTYPNGSCVSIMRSGLGDCRDRYNVNSRAAYIDELFDPNTVSANMSIIP